VSAELPLAPYMGDSFDLAGLAQALATVAGHDPGGMWGETAWQSIAAAAEAVPGRYNRGFRLGLSGQVPGVTATLFAAASQRRLPPLPPDEGRCPPWLRGGVAATPGLRLVRVDRGWLLHLGHVPLIVAGDGRTVLRDCSSRYAPLLHHIDRDLRGAMHTAREVPGALFVLHDDVWPPNFAHWILDTLPRLAVIDQIAPERDAFIAIPPLTAAWQRTALHLAGIEDGRIVEVGIGQAVQARTVLATDDRPSPPHPAFRAAPWALRFLRRMREKVSIPDDRSGGLYVSRHDSEGRRVVNEAELMAALAPRGFRRVLLSELDLSAQIAAFASARAIIAPHGAGLANLAFAARGTHVLELFPQSHGTAAFRLLAAGVGLSYHYLVSDDLTAAARPEFHDMRVDPARVLAFCDAVR
jgi:hypothetical protein